MGKIWAVYGSASTRAPELFAQSQLLKMPVGKLAANPIRCRHCLDLFTSGGEIHPSTLPAWVEESVSVWPALVTMLKGPAPTSLSPAVLCTRAPRPPPDTWLKYGRLPVHIQLPPQWLTWHFSLYCVAHPAFSNVYIDFKTKYHITECYGANTALQIMVYVCFLVFSGAFSAYSNE